MPQMLGREILASPAGSRPVKGKKRGIYRWK
jgi:hypothetical protein